MTKPVLYCFGESGNAYRAALCMTLSGFAYETRFVDFFNGEARKEDYTSNVNAMGEVPALDYNGKIYTQSAVIMEIVSKETGKFTAQNREDELDVMRWTIWDNQKLSGFAGPARFFHNFLPEKHRKQDVLDFLKGRALASLKIINTHLADRDWVATDYPTTADFSCCSYLYYPEPFGFNRADWPHVDAWLDRIAALPSWQHPYDLMQRGFPPKVAS
ncbi:MAG: glutathione S-transferase family protein [Pseudomonadota bacterium]